MSQIIDPFPWRGPENILASRIMFADQCTWGTLRDDHMRSGIDVHPLSSGETPG